MGEFGVSDKEPKTNSSSTSSSSRSSGVVGLGVNNKVQQQQQTLEAFPSKNMMMMMMAHHNHHHRSLSPPFDNDSCIAAPTAAAGDGDGPTPTTTYMSNLTNHINVVTTTATGAYYSALGVTAIDGAVAASVPVRPLQPFDISAPYTSATTTYPPFKSPPDVMAASLGFPFTSAQWKELQRQAMIYKYMMASVPVPHDLLISTASRSPLNGGFNLRLSSSTDPEPGRCRRTDGKKWRCSRDVAPNHKYCERHMHRGRPRSRKPVEVHTNNNQQQIKRARHDCSNPFPTSDVSVAISNPTTRKDGSSSQFVAASATSQSYLESSSLSLHNFGVKAGNFDSMASVSSNKEPRGLEWMLNGDPISLGASDTELQCLMHNKVGLTTESSCNNTQPQYLNSFALYSSGVLDQQNRRPPMFLNPLLFPMENLQSQKPRGFIDAWSNTETEENNANTNNKSNVSSIGKLSLSSLDLSMGGGCVHEEIGTIEMGLGLMEPDGNTQHNDTKTHLTNWLTPAPWVPSTTPGGPLAEVLRPSTVTATATNPSSPVITHAESSSPLRTWASSPSGVLQKTLASLSDSSSNSSPRVASSRTNSDIALLRFNQK